MVFPLIAESAAAAAPPTAYSELRISEPTLASSDPASASSELRSERMLAEAGKLPPPHTKKLVPVAGFPRKFYFATIFGNIGVFITF